MFEPRDPHKVVYEERLSRSLVRRSALVLQSIVVVVACALATAGLTWVGLEYFNAIRLVVDE